MSEKTLNEIDVLNQLMSILAELDSEGRKKMLVTVATFFDIDHISSTDELPTNSTASQGLSYAQSTPYSETLDLSPKEFLRQKGPQSDVERIACLAYYLTHYRETTNFKTIDLSKLNTEAAQPKLSNPAKAASNALQYGYLAQSIKGHRQLSAVGEEYVSALPDRDLAKATIASSRPKKRSASKKKSNTKNYQDD